MLVQSILGPKGLAIAADVGLVLACIAFLWGAIKLAYQRTQGHAMPRNLVTKVLDIGVEAFNIVWGTVNRAVKLDTGRGLFLPTLPADGSPPSAGAAAVDALATENTRLRTALADYQRRAVDSHAVTEPTPRRGESGRVSVGALGYVALLCVIVAAAMHCIPARRLILDHTDGVPARGSCTPRTQRCTRLDAGVYLPVACSDEHREWSTLPLTPLGDQRTCAYGEGCEVTDAGVAHCTAADGGAR